MPIYAAFAEINGLFKLVGQSLWLLYLSLRQAASFSIQQPFPFLRSAFMAAIVPYSAIIQLSPTDCGWIRFCNLASKEGFAENYNTVTGPALCDRAYTWTSSVFLILASQYL